MLKKCRFLLLFLITALWGCNSLPMAPLLFINPMEVDPGVFRLALAGPQYLRLQKKGAVLQLHYEVETPNTVMQENVSANLYFEQDPWPQWDGDLQQKMKNDQLQRVVVYRLKAEDVAQLRQIQTQVRAYKAADGKGKGSLKFQLDSACLETNVPAGPLYSQVYVRTDPKQGFFSLSERFDLRQIPGVAERIDTWPRCQ
ncbi:MAG: hypothetical protein IGS03_18725 [Candidatus Sericytochromatia bacterium]|nr:hypothetical protein [Candidatus Sericytochromatia bacterium]